MLPKVTGPAGPRPSYAIGPKEAGSDSCEGEGPQGVSLGGGVGQGGASGQPVSLGHLGLLRMSLTPKSCLQLVAPLAFSLLTSGRFPCPPGEEFWPPPGEGLDTGMAPGQVVCQPGRSLSGVVTVLLPAGWVGQHSFASECCWRP